MFQGGEEPSQGFWVDSISTVSNHLWAILINAKYVVQTAIDV
jgi:hypothetical protein